MDKKLSTTRRKTLVGIGAIGFAASMPSIRASAQSPTSYKFGMAMPLTGSQATYGQDQVRAAQWAMEEITRAGGVNGKKLEMVLLDTQADARLGIQAANRLASVEKVPVFVTAWSDVVKAIAPVANDSKTVALSVGANSAEIARLGDYVYTTYPLADVDITALAKYCVGKLGYKRGAVLYINNETGKVASEIYRKVFREAGGEVVAFEAYDPRATDWTGQVLKVRAANPDVIHVQGLAADAPGVIVQIRQLGLKQRVTSYSALFNPGLIKQLGVNSEGMIATSLAPSAARDPKVAAYIERWKKEVGREPNGLPYTQYLYDTPYFVRDVLKSLDAKKAAVTGESFRAEMLAIRDFDLPLTGRLTLRDDHTVGKTVYLMEVKNGVWTELAAID